MGFKDLREFYDPHLYLPVGGKRYKIPAPSMEQARRLKTLVATEVTLDRELAEITELFGPLSDELLADGVSWTEYLHVGKTALLWVGAGQKVAEAFWHFAQLGQLVDLDKLPQANRAQRRAAMKAAAAEARKAG